MKILITGSEGFIGRNLREYLQDSPIALFDKKDNPRNDVCEYASYRIKALNFGPDIIIHLAAFTNVIESIKHPELCIDQNCEGMNNTISIAEDLKCKVIFASSCGAKEPANPYTYSKLTCEEICRDSQVDVTILRLSNVYGCKYSDHKTSVIHKIYRELNEGKPITVYGDGEQTRDFVNVKDVCRAIENAIHKVKGFNLYEIGTGREASINNLIDIFRDHCHMHVIYEDKRPGEALSSFADIEKARDALDYNPSITLENGIAEFYE